LNNSTRLKRYDFNFDLNSYTEDTDLQRRLNFSLDLECMGQNIICGLQTSEWLIQV